MSESFYELVTPMKFLYLIARKLYGLEDFLIFQVPNGIWEPQIESQAETDTHGLSLKWEKLIYLSISNI